MNKERPQSEPVQATEYTFICEVLQAESDAINRISHQIESNHAIQEQWSKAIDILEACTGHVVFSGMGKSGLVGAKLSATFSSIGQPSHVVHPAEALHGDIGSIKKNDVVILMSYSGTTEEVVNLAAILRTDNVPRIGISSSGDSPLAKLCDVHLSTGAITEACPLNLAPTASTTATLAVGDALGLAVSRRRNFSADDFHKHHPGGMLGTGLRGIMEILRFKVGDNLPTVHESTSVGDALLAARPAPNKRRAGAILLIDDNNKLVGIFTDGDLRRLVIDDKQPMIREIGKVATSNPRRLLTSALVRDAKQLFTEHRVDEIPVVDEENHPVGLIDVQDLIALKVVAE